MNKEQELVVEGLMKQILVIDDHMTSTKDYRMLIENYYEAIKTGFEFVECRCCPIRFKFHESDEEMHTLELRHFITNLFLWEPFARLETYEDMDSTCILDCTTITTDSIKEFLDEKIIKPYRKDVGNYKLNKITHDVIYNLGRISSDFNEILALSMNVESFMHIAERNPRFNELIRTKVDQSMQPQDVEHLLGQLTEETISILSQEDGCLKPILRSGTGIKSGQLKEFAINGGYKPDLAGNTIPISVNSNFIVGGLSNATHYYIDAIGGRKSIIMNSTVMGLSGHFTRLILLLASDLRMNKHEHDCGTVHAAKIEIKSETHLRKLVGRNYRLPHQRTYRILRADQTELIGETIYVRSPVYCADEEICSTCYGELFYTNRDLESVGGYSATKITEPVSQSILSSKHLLTTDSEKIEFENPLFDKFFSIYANEISLVQDDEDVDLSRYDLVIIKDNIIKIDPFDDMESEFNKFVNIFHILDKETGEMIEFRDKKGKDLYLAPELDEFIREMKTQKKGNKKSKKADSPLGKNVIVLPLDQYSHKDRIFVVEVENNELTRPLYAIIDLLDNSLKREQSGVYTADQMIQRMLDLLIISKISADSIHGELLIRCLIRSLHNVLELPDFRRYDAKNDIAIMTIKSALEKHPSVTISLSFQAINRQLQNLLTFKKTKPSYIDPFFKQ